MNLNAEHYRALIIYDFRSNLNQQQCYDRLVAAFGEESAPSLTTINNLYAEIQGFTAGEHPVEQDESTEEAANTSKKKIKVTDK